MKPNKDKTVPTNDRMYKLIEKKYTSNQKLSWDDACVDVYHDLYIIDIPNYALEALGYIKKMPFEIMVIKIADKIWSLEGLGIHDKIIDKREWFKCISNVHNQLKELDK